jgi:hypothetical protein
MNLKKIYLEENNTHQNHVVMVPEELVQQD